MARARIERSSAQRTKEVDADFVGSLAHEIDALARCRRVNRGPRPAVRD
jgi:hypothetical protein